MTRAWIGTMTMALTLAACSKKEPTTDVTPPREEAPTTGGRSTVKVAPALLASKRVQTAHVEKRPLRGDVRLPGEVVADEAGEGDATTLVAGRVASLEVLDGQQVKQGQILAWIDAPEAARAAAAWLRARGMSEQSGRLLARQLELQSENATSKNAVDEARANDAAAKAEWIAARSLLRSYGAPEPDGESVATIRVPVRAPIDGVIAQRHTAVGSPVVPERSLFRVISPKRVYVAAKIPETMASLTKAGDRAHVFPRDLESGEPCVATVVSVFGVVEADRQVRVRLAPVVPCAGLSAGRYADVAFAASPNDVPVLAVPKEAVVDVKGASVVFVARGDGTFEVRPVRVGASTGSELAVEDGVAAGEAIAVAGAVLLKGELLRAELE